jgi:archaellum component FlaC
MDDSKVAVLLDNIQAQFRAFGEGLQLLNEKMDREFNEVKGNINNIKSEITNLKYEFNSFKTENRQEHQQIIQMIKELDTEVVQLKRVK